MRLDTNVPVSFVSDLDGEGIRPMVFQLAASSPSTAGVEVTHDVQGFGDCPDFNWDDDIVRFWDFRPLDGNRS